MSLSPEYLKYLSLKCVKTTMVGGNFHIYDVQITGKCICQSNIYYASSDKTLPAHVLTIIPQEEVHIIAGRGSPNASLKNSYTGMRYQPSISNPLSKDFRNPNVKRSLTTNVLYVALQLFSVLNSKNPNLTNHSFEQREVLLNHIDHSIDAQIFKYQNMQ